MKTFGIIIAFLALLGLAVMATVPTDQQCIQQATNKAIGVDMPVIEWAASTVASSIYTVDNQVFYKIIRNRITGQVVGYAYLGTVVIQ
jgi:hypothetical protein